MTKPPSYDQSIIPNITSAISISNLHRAFALVSRGLLVMASTSQSAALVHMMVVEVCDFPPIPFILVNEMTACPLDSHYDSMSAVRWLRRSTMVSKIVSSF